MSALYRADIDGLRAIAVSAVVLYHVFPEWLRGGFVGVDIFFVISGYLISSVIFREIERGRFTFADFYARRIRRIFPALALVLAACLGLGWMLLFPEEYRSVGKHVAAGAGFLSNIALWREAGYFDAAAESKPLLHLWSLGIEEQFYIVWPVLASWLLLRRRWFATALVTLALVSFGLNIGVMGRSQTAAFYLPLTRFWELAAGGALAYCNLTRGQLLVGLRAEGAAAGGLALLLFSIWHTPPEAFPGWWALAPVTATVLLIAAGPTTGLGRYLLSSSPFVFIGLISYPLYLWHWPLLTFLRLADADWAGYWPVRSAIILLCLVLAWLTYRFVETPVRTRHAHARTAVLLAVAVACLGAAGWWTTRGELRWLRLSLFTEPGKKDAPAITPSRAGCVTPTGLALDFCRQSQPGEPTAVVFGDSHAEHHYPGLARMDGQRNWLLLGHPSCPPVNEIEVENYTPRCRERTEHATRYLAAQPSVELVVLAFYGGYFLTTDLAADHVSNGYGPSRTRIAGPGMAGWSREKIFLTGLLRTVEALEAAGKKVVVILSGPELSFYPRDRLRLAFTSEAALARLTIGRDRVLARQAALRQGVLELQRQRPGLRVFDLLDWLCEGDECRLLDDGVLLYRDSHHLTDSGSYQSARRILSWLAQGS